MECKAQNLHSDILENCNIAANKLNHIVEFIYLRNLAMLLTFHCSRPYLDPFYDNLTTMRPCEPSKLNGNIPLLPVQTRFVQFYVDLLLYPSSIASHAHTIRF